jgi:hypothetical protein
MLWYHDHALGINRLNVYAGLLGAFFIRDGVEEALNLPKGKYECHSFFMIAADARWPASLSRFARSDKSPWVPEVFGNAILVNGKLFPYLDVEPRRYRFRVLNASNARIYHLSFGDRLPTMCPFTKSERTRVYCLRRFRSRALKSRRGNAPISSSTSVSIAARNWFSRTTLSLSCNFASLQRTCCNPFTARMYWARSKAPGSGQRSWLMLPCIWCTDSYSCSSIHSTTPCST